MLYSSEIVFPTHSYIGGRYVEHEGGAFEVRKPSNGEVAGVVREATAEGVNLAVEVALKALRESAWSTGSPRVRGNILKNWARLIGQDAETLASWESSVSTRPVSEVLKGDIPTAVELVRYFAEWADKIGGNIVPTNWQSLGFELHEPFGVVAAITPWNFPIGMAIWKCAPALAAGNAVVLKPSEFTPFSALRLAELAVQAGVPAGILNVVQGSGSVTGKALVEHQGVARVTFTGSGATGRAIMATAALAGPKPVTLELGGKCPHIVFADAKDLEIVADNIVRGFTYNAGQVCVSGSRLLVQRECVDDLLQRVRTRLDSYKPGPTWDSASSFSPLIHDQHHAHVHGMVEDALAAGAGLLRGEQTFDGGTRFYPPTVLTDVPATARAWNDEIFGPVLAVKSFDDEDEALHLANDSPFGLAAGVWTGDLGCALRITRRLEVGTVWVNRYGRSDDFGLSTGGYKSSGFGKDLGVEAIRSNLRVKSVLIDCASSEAWSV